MGFCLEVLVWEPVGHPSTNSVAVDKGTEAYGCTSSMHVLCPLTGKAVISPTMCLILHPGALPLL